MDLKIVRWTGDETVIPDCHYDKNHNGSPLRMGEWKQDSATCLNMDPEPQKQCLFSIVFSSIINRSWDGGLNHSESWAMGFA